MNRESQSYAIFRAFPVRHVFFLLKTVHDMRGECGTAPFFFKKNQLQ